MTVTTLIALGMSVIVVESKFTSTARNVNVWRGDWSVSSNLSDKDNVSGLSTDNDNWAGYDWDGRWRLLWRQGQHQILQSYVLNLIYLGGVIH